MPQLSPSGANGLDIRSDAGMTLEQGCWSLRHMGKLLSQENDGPVSECSRHKEQQGYADAFSSKVKIGLPNRKHNGIAFQRYARAVCLWSSSDPVTLKVTRKLSSLLLGYSQRKDMSECENSPLQVDSQELRDSISTG